MKLECLKEMLREGVIRTERAVSKNSTLPVLNGIFLSAQNKTLTIRATNLDIGIEFKIPAKVEKEGFVVVPSSFFVHLLSGLGDSKTISLEEKNGNIFIEGKNNKALVKCLPSGDFPTLPIIKDGSSFVINTKDLSDGIRSVLYSASFSDIKPELASVFIYKQNNDLLFVSTDSFRLAEKRINNKSIKELHGIIIPQKNTQELQKAFEGYEGETMVSFSKNQISCTLDNLYFTSRIIEGVFPDYKQIIPKEHKTEAILLKEDFINALKISTLFSNKFNQTTIVISPSKKLFSLTTENQDIGENTTRIEAALSGEDVEVVCNYRYILDCFQSIHADSVVVRCSGPEKPVTIQGSGDNSFLYLVMPMNK